MLARMLLVVTLFGGAAVSDAAGFPCKKAQSRVEKAICADPELSTLDEHMGRYYPAAKADLGEGGDCLKTDQLHWLKAVRDVCADKACLKKVYLDRLSELDALQPGMNAIKYLDLPFRPSLVWVIPPSKDNVVARYNPNATPMEAKGTLVNEIADGDGFVLHTPAGESYVLVPLMLLKGDTGDRLLELARYVEAKYWVRGYGNKGEKGRRFFEPSRCVYIYRLDTRETNR